MDQNKASDFDSLAAEIDNAVEDLFGSYESTQAPVSAKSKSAVKPKPLAPQTPPPQSQRPIQSPQPTAPAPKPVSDVSARKVQAPSELDAEIDKAVDDLFGAYTIPKPTLSKQPAPSPAQKIEPQMGVESAPPQPRPPETPAPPSPQELVMESTPAPQPEVEIQIEAPPATAPIKNETTSELSAEIDNAVEELFGAYASPKPTKQASPSSPKVEKPTAPSKDEPPQPMVEQTISIEMEPPLSIVEEAAVPTESLSENLWELLEQSFLTIDWEVTSANVQAAKRVFDKLRADLQIDSNAKLEPVIQCMDQILESMARSPETVPTTGPPALKEGAEALRIAYQNFNDAAQAQLASALKTLQTALPEVTTAEKTAQPNASEGAAGALQRHLQFLAKGVNNASTFENLFSQKPSYKKLQNAEVKLRTNFQGQQEKIQELFNELASTGVAVLSSSHADFIDSHISVLEQCIKIIQSIENLFSQQEAHKKIFNAHHTLLLALEKQIQDIRAIAPTGLGGAIEIQIEPDEDIPSISSFTSSAVSTDQPAPSTMESISSSLFDETEVQSISSVATIETEEIIELDTPDEPEIQANQSTELFDLMYTHMDGLERCKNNITPLENLFKKPGHEKIQSILQSVSTEIDNQINSIANILNGDFQATSANFGAGVSGAVANVRCPWKELITTEWQGQIVAFIPNEVAYEQKAPGWLKSKQGRLSMLPVIKLKKHFWSKLSPLFKGEMKFLGETYLKHMKVPILSHISSISRKGKPPKKASLIVLFNEGNSGAVLLDAPTKVFSVSNNWKWQPINQKGQILAGYLTTKDESIPVITIARI